MTTHISELTELCIKEAGPYQANVPGLVLQEQLEEVSSMDKLLKMVQRAGEDRLLNVEKFLVSKIDEGSKRSTAGKLQQ